MEPDWPVKTPIIYLKLGVTTRRYEKFNIHFNSAKLWNDIQEDLKSKSCTCFKNFLKESIILKY